MRPSGVVSYVFPLNVAPCNITTGTPVSRSGTMNSTYIWSIVMSPAFVGGVPQILESCVGVCLTMPPPTTKLPRLFSLRGPPGVLIVASVCEKTTVGAAVRRVVPSKMQMHSVRKRLVFIMNLSRRDAYHGLVEHIPYNGYRGIAFVHHATATAGLALQRTGLARRRPVIGEGRKNV